MRFFGATRKPILSSLFGYIFLHLQPPPPCPPFFDTFEQWVLTSEKRQPLPPLPITIKISPGGNGQLNKLEKIFQNTDLGWDVLYYNNWFDLEVIGSRQVKNLTKLQEFNYVSHIEYKKVYHKKIGKYTERRLRIVLKIRSKLTPFFLLF